VRVREGGGGRAGSPRSEITVSLLREGMECNSEGFPRGAKPKLACLSRGRTAVESGLRGFTEPHRTTMPPQQ
jgi:hypothetical protein